MTAVVAMSLGLAVALFVILPLLRQAGEQELETGSAGNELWTREKAVAVLAITEADFDRATGKLSDDDYRVLRSDYEGRALQAMAEIDRAAPVATGVDRFCAECGSPLAAADLFCGACGRRRITH